MSMWSKATIVAAHRVHEREGGWIAGDNRETGASGRSRREGNWASSGAETQDLGPRSSQGTTKCDQRKSEAHNRSFCCCCCSALIWSDLVLVTRRRGRGLVGECGAREPSIEPILGRRETSYMQQIWRGIDRRNGGADLDAVLICGLLLVLCSACAGERRWSVVLRLGWLGVLSFVEGGRGGGGARALRFWVCWAAGTAAFSISVGS